ncbi:MAG TPA: hypothetical protein PK218_11035 [Flavobacterium sp.]|jgi:hypothetical protein|nr:hypothetical protein [Flavobacterium sp.]
MRKLFLFIIILSFTTTIKAQNCSDWVITEYDEVTDITVISMKDRMYIDKDGQRKVSIHVAQKIENGEKETVLTIDIKDGGCISNQNGIIFLFTDGTRLKELNHGADNCVGFAMLNIGIPDYEGNTIKSYLEQKKIKTLRVYTNDSFVQVDFTESNQNKLIETLKCID